MGTKRPHHNDSIPESDPHRIPTHPPKRRRSNDSAPPTTKPPSINHLKSKIRDLTRALEHSDHLPAGVRIEKEWALAGYKQDVEKIHQDKRKSELIKKYHMVRFFERQKATRALKKLQRRLDASSEPDASDEHAQLAREVRDAQIDVHYTIYYPLTEKYQSLYPRQGDTSGGEKPTAARKLVAEKPAMWKVVERCAAEGTLEALREGKVIAAMEKRRESKNGGRAAGSKKALKRPGTQEQEQDEAKSDGGFFEE